MSRLTEKFCKLVALESESTAKEYGWRLASLESFFEGKYGMQIDSFFDKLSEFDVYDVGVNYHAYLKKTGLHSNTIAARLATAKTFLEYNKVPIVNTQWRLNVRPPKRVKPDKQGLDKVHVRNIILACKDIRLQSYVLLLAATGIRAVEALSIRLKDINWDNHTVMLRAVYTKTKNQRFVYLTNECVKYLKSWQEFRERKHIVVNKNEQDKWTKYLVERKLAPTDLFFTSGRHEDVNDPNGLYHSLVPEFRAVTDRNGFAEKYDNKGKRHKISLHTFRTYVKSTISDLGHGDYAEWFIGHEGSTYYSKTDSERLKIFKKIEPYLTYLEYGELEAKGADVETKLDQKDQEIQAMKQQIKEDHQSRIEQQKILEQMKHELNSIRSAIKAAEK